MDKFKRTLSLKKKKDTGGESSKPHQWQEDERKVREGCCSFHVKYLGCIEVFESRGIQVCEEAVKALKNRKSRSIWSRMSLRRKKKDETQQSKSGHHNAVLYVTGDALRVVDEISKGLIVDQTIEKVSFCAPDRNHDRGFAYICRDGTTRRWMCHGFLATKESGERLSHAVGCAFAICLEKKQQREKEKVSVTYNDNGTSFTRLGSFRQASVTERLADPQSAIVAEPVPSKPTSNPYAVQRPHAPADLLERQGSFRSFQKLADSSPFKRNVSLRLNELPSNLERQKQFTGLDGPEITSNGKNSIGTIMEAEEQDPFSPSPPVDTFASLQINLKTTVATSTTNNTITIPSITTSSTLGIFQNGKTLNFSPSRTSTTLPSNNAFILNPDSHCLPITQSNPWADSGKPASRTSEAESWLNATASKIDPFAFVPSNNVFAARSQHLQQPPQQFPGMVESFTSVANQQLVISQAASTFAMQYPGVVSIPSSLGYNQAQQFYPAMYPVQHQIACHVSPILPGMQNTTNPVIPGSLVHQDGNLLHQAHVHAQTPTSQQFVIAPSNPHSNNVAFFGTSTTMLQNVQPLTSTADQFKPNSMWSSATNPFKTGNDVSQFQLKI